MQTPKHIQKSLERLREQDKTHLYNLAPKKVEEIVSEVHKTLDAFTVASEVNEDRLRNREKLHHEEGINQVVKELSGIYGKIYEPLILQEAQAHVQDDMRCIPKKSDYQDPHFWPKWQAQNELIFNE